MNDIIVNDNDFFNDLIFSYFLPSLKIAKSLSLYLFLLENW